MTKTGKTPEPLKINDFAVVVSDKKIQDSPLRVGDLVLIMAYKVVPAKRDDPYLQRALVLVAKSEDGVMLIPEGEDSPHELHMVDPRSLEKASDAVQEEAMERLVRQFTPKVVGD